MRFFEFFISRLPSFNSSKLKQLKTAFICQKNLFEIYLANNTHKQLIKMNKQIIVLIALFAMVAVALANDGYGQHYEPEEKRFIQLPALKLKIGMDKLMFKLPNLGSIFQTHKEHNYPQHY